MATCDADTEWLVVGKVGSANGLKGWTKLTSYTEPPENILNYQPLYLKQDGSWRLVEVAESRVQAKNIVVRFAESSNREEASLLTNKLLAIATEQLPDLPDDEFYWQDLVGMQVVTETGVELGKVDHLFATGSNDVMVVEGQRSHLVPFIINDFVKSVDKNTNKIVVDWDPEF